MQARREARDKRAAFGAGFIANGDDVRECPAGLEHVRDGFRLVTGDVYADFPHGFDDDWVQLSRLQPCTVGFELLAAKLVQERLGHLAAGAVVNADEKDFLFHY